MNYLQAVQRLHRESGRSGSGPTGIATANASQLRLFDAIADAVRTLEARPVEWRWMQRAAVAALGFQLEYTGADLGISDFGRWRPTTDSYDPRAFLPADPYNSWRLEFLPYDDWRALYYDRNPPVGRPMHWSTAPDETLLIGPKADQTYSLKIDYVREPQELADDDDQLALPKRHHMIVVWHALKKVAEFDNAPETLTRANREFRDAEVALLDDQGPKFYLGGSLA